MRLTRRGYDALVRRQRRIGYAPVEVRTVTVDPDGRRRIQHHVFIVNAQPKKTRAVS